MSPLAIFGIIVAFVVFFIALWLFVININSWLSGWRGMAKHFTATYKPEGEKLRWQRAMLQWGVNYSGVLDVIIADEGFTWCRCGCFAVDINRC